MVWEEIPELISDWNWLNLKEMCEFGIILGSVVVLGLIFKWKLKRPEK